MSRVALFAERYLLSAVFLYYAWAQAGPLWSGLHALPGPPALYTVALPEVTKSLLVMLFDAFVGSLLLLSRSPSIPPKGAKEVVVPLVANFFYLAYNLTALAPEALTRNLLPVAWRLPLGFAALYLSLLAFALALWAVVRLGRSFGVLVAVRPLVTSGPYRYVRHPIYLAYVLQMAALLIGHGSVLVALLVTCHLLLTVWRARLEEARLAEHTPAYRSYRDKTGFLLPKL